MDAAGESRSGPNDGLYGVGAVSSSDVWAVGSYEPSGGSSAGVILHYDGSAWGTAEPEPDAGSSRRWRSTARAMHGPWGGPDGPSTYVLHWNGTSGPHQASPSEDAVSLSSVSAAGPSRRVGGGPGGTERGPRSTAGPSRRRFGLADPVGAVPARRRRSLRRGAIASDARLGRRDVHDADQDPGRPHPPLGRRAVDAGLRPADGHAGRPAGREAIASDDVWAVGLHYKGGSARTLIEHWDGAAWSVVDSPNGGGNTSCWASPRQGRTTRSPSATGDPGRIQNVRAALRLLRRPQKERGKPSTCSPR